MESLALKKIEREEKGEEKTHSAEQRQIKIYNYKTHTYR